MNLRPALVYTLLRGLLFVVVAALLYLAGARSLLLVVLALVISGLVSYLLLARQREAFTAEVLHRGRRARARLDAAAASEDDDDAGGVRRPDGATRQRDQ